MVDSVGRTELPSPKDMPAADPPKTHYSPYRSWVRLDLLRGQVRKLLRDHPQVPERVLQPAAPAAVPLVADRVHDAGATAHERRTDRIGVVHVERQDPASFTTRRG
jgi:hypothetical protein